MSAISLESSAIDNYGGSHSVIGISAHLGSIKLFASQKRLLQYCYEGTMLYVTIGTLDKESVLAEPEAAVVDGKTIIIYLHGRPLGYLVGKEMKAVREALQLSLADKEDIRLVGVCLKSDIDTEEFDFRINYLYPIMTPGKFKWEYTLKGIFAKYAVSDISMFVRQESTDSNKGHLYDLQRHVRSVRVVEDGDGELDVVDP